MSPEPQSSNPAGWRLEQSYARLPAALFVRLAPEPVSRPRLVVFNRRLAAALGMEADALSGDEGAAIFGGNLLPPGADPLAQAYAGHQYGHFTSLGDGRAILLGEQITPLGERFDIQLKGSGRTPFSRGGDGRAALGPMLREYIVSEAMHALGIPTTRSLAVVATGDEVYRPEALPGAVLTRVAASHLRVGTMEWASAQGDPEVLQELVAYTLERHYPDRVGAQSPGLCLLEAVLERQASLIARWQAVGFVHGVMNTDNMALSGETIDYGPCAFMDRYDPSTVFSSIDRFGRYAYANQPHIAQWNLARLAEALLPLIDDDSQRALDLASAAVYRFPDRFRHHWLAGMTAKLGLFAVQEGDQALVDDLLGWMHRAQADFTNTWADIATGQLSDQLNDPEFAAWHDRWVVRRAAQAETAEEANRLMQASTPAYIPRNHLVEEALTAAFRQNDLSPLQRLMAVIAHPYDHEREAPGYRGPSPTEAEPYRTFCGT